MPSRKPLVAIDRMPGMMISREMAKKMFRRPMMLSFRTRGSGRGGRVLSSSGFSCVFSCGGTMSAVCSAGAMSDSSDIAVDSHQRRATQGAASHDDREQVVSDDDRGDEAGDDADTERDGKTLHLRGAHEAQDHAGDKRRGVGDAEGGPGAPDGCVDSSGYGPAGADLLLEALEDQHIGVDGHAHGQDEPCL